MRCVVCEWPVKNGAMSKISSLFGTCCPACEEIWKRISPTKQQEILQTQTTKWSAHEALKASP